MLCVSCSVSQIVLSGIRKQGRPLPLVPVFSVSVAVSGFCSILDALRSKSRRFFGSVNGFTIHSIIKSLIVYISYIELLISVKTVNHCISVCTRLNVVHWRYAYQRAVVVNITIICFFTPLLLTLRNGSMVTVRYSALPSVIN